jgi:menaquinone-specific isochorismate synthase
MEIIDIPLEDKADPDDLRRFLEACRDAADTDGHDKIASISLGVRHIDPLAVLDSIYEGEAHHFYMENRQREWAVAGAEAVVSGVFNGPGRFDEAKAFARSMDPHIIAIGDMTLPFSGPLFFSGFTFMDETDPGEPFPSCLVFIPQWQVARSGDRHVAVANALVRPGVDVAPVAERIWSAHRKFVSFNYDQPPPAPVYHIIKEEEVGPEGAFTANVERALSRIGEGAYDKVVLSRALDLVFDNPCQPLKILNRLRQDYPQCSTFSLQHENGASFIGATPERLVAVSSGHYTTEAIAGSAPRDPDARMDARLAGGLLSSNKDLREHQHVVDSILRRLSGLGLEASVAPRPGILALPNVQHLRTAIEGELPEDLHILDLAAELHPTPAVGGTPREAAVPDIREWEPFPRGLFAGLSGWFDTRGNGEFAVGIRSALTRGSSARLYAGAGIVEGSEPEAELRETSLKMEALLKCIRGEAG